MTTQLVTVATKPNDFTICVNCKSLNFYENDKCCSCGNNHFDKELVLGFVEDEYSFYENEEGYSETEIDDLEIQC